MLHARRVPKNRALLAGPRSVTPYGPAVLTPCMSDCTWNPISRPTNHPKTGNATRAFVESIRRGRSLRLSFCEFYSPPAHLIPDLGKPYFKKNISNKCCGATSQSNRNGSAIANPVTVRTGSMRSTILQCGTITSARPPVATTSGSPRPHSSTILVTIPSIPSTTP